MSTSPSWLIRSNPLTFGTTTNGSSATIFTNTRAGSTFVVTFITLINLTLGGSESAQVVEQPSGVTVHSGSVGAGAFDRFPLTCVIALQTGASLTIAQVAGDWSVAITGFYTPTTATS